MLLVHTFLGLTDKFVIMRNKMLHDLWLICIVWEYVFILVSMWMVCFRSHNYCVLGFKRQDFVVPSMQVQFYKNEKDGHLY